MKTLIAAALLATSLSVSVGGVALAQNPVTTAADRGPCRDPWINYAYRVNHKRQPVGRADMGECNIYLYAGGAWQNYGQLSAAVDGFVGATGNAGAAVQAFGNVFSLVDKLTGGRLRMQVKTATKQLDINGTPVYSLLSTADGAKSYAPSSGTTLLIAK